MRDLDRFVLAKLEEKSLRPVEDASPLTLLRRLHFDLTGLPPTANEIVDVLPMGTHPDTRSVRAANMCRIGLHRPKPGDAPGDTLVICSVIDNLVKGASGQAVQNMNIMFGLPETMGLEQLPVLP